MIKKTFGASVAAFSLVTASAAVASAQVAPAYGTTYAGEDVTVTGRPIRAPMRAFELGAGISYAQGIGSLDRGVGFEERAATDPGLGFGLSAGYRMNPHMGIHALGEFGTYGVDDRVGAAARAQTLTTSIVGSFHFAPYERLDPYLHAGAGYRLLWTTPAGPANDVLTHGFQLARLDVGLDVRASESVALGPFVGADLTYFVWNNPEAAGGDQVIDDRRIHPFVRAGVQGRFDLGGARSRTDAVIGRR